jgi:uncharacterized CHY-type Zn-finger protein
MTNEQREKPWIRRCGECTRHITVPQYANFGVCDACLIMRTKATLIRMQNRARYMRTIVDRMIANSAR